MSERDMRRASVERAIAHEGVIDGRAAGMPMTHDEALKLLRKQAEELRQFDAELRRNGWKPDGDPVNRGESEDAIADLLEAWAVAWDEATFEIESIREDVERNPRITSLRVAGAVLGTMKRRDPRGAQ